ncbi:hypothetical protein CY0110_19822 [Crocosphaera chwakensis CCY0110]|uniref:Uncharacterized protein n=1 Tax=Crocosphaera chwakensis CCY0110 TaxID=391612 RepID=A3IJU6_9CHRO|nr:hypothetical protein CY0110_19822 [Crocosphaera chwakensis CCY0110]
MTRSSTDPNEVSKIKKVVAKSGILFT